MEKVLELKNITKIFKVNKKEFKAVDNVSLDVKKGQIVGLIGESGSGKSTVANLVTYLKKITSGNIILLGKDITEYNKENTKFLQENVQLIFQDAISSLNPRMKVKDILEEGLRNLVKEKLDKKTLNEKARKVLSEVELSESYMDKYPYELSGGEAQRVAIARAIIVEPKLLVCDEATSALDVSVQAQIIRLLLKLRDEKGISILFISHNLPMISCFSDYIYIMKEGKIKEEGITKEVVKNPKNPYTKMLLDSILEVK